ncbi:MAG: T9SS type A sorting domain-containing protein [Bacteroidetes bacterium]|nr:T9SS type A sorting domain-containing protein [Bacteroidota bacterium]
MNKIFTLFVIAFLISFSSKAGALSGNYTIGGTTPNYSTISQAVFDLNQFGISGKVVFNIRPGSYPEQFTINNINGVSAIDTIVFQSETNKKDDVTIEHIGTPGGTFVFKLNNAKGITFKNLTFKNYSPTNSTIGQFVNDVSNIHFVNNSFIVPVTNQINDSLSIFYAANSMDVNVSFNGNYFEGGSYGLNFKGDVAKKSYGLRLNSNQFKSQYQNCASMSNYASGIQITTNIMKMDGSAGSSLVSLLGVDDMISITQNIFACNQGMGVYLNSCYPTSTNPLNVFNNKFMCKNALAALSIMSTNCVKVICNTFYTEHNDNNHFALSMQGSDFIDIDNNLFLNNNGGTILFVQGPGASTGSDKNVFAGNCKVGAIGTLAFASLSDWQTAMNYDALSTVEAFPIFVNDDLTSLRLSCANSTNYKKPKSTKAPVSIDFDNNSRGAMVWCGAQEVQYGSNKSYVKGRVKVGSDTIKAGKVYLYANVTIEHKWNIVDSMDIQLDGSFSSTAVPLRKYILQAVPKAIDYPDLIPTYQSGDFNWDSTKTFLSDTCHVIYKDIDVIQLLSNPSGSATISGYVYNDGSFKTNDPIPGLDVILDKIPPSKSVQKTKTDANGYYVFNNISAGHYQVNIDVTGIVVDSLYSVDVVGSETHATLDYCIDSLVGLCFGQSSSTNIVKKSNDLMVWPNPVQNQLNILLPQSKELYRVDIFDVVGKQIYSTSAVGGAQTFNVDLTGVTEGIYFVKISSADIVTEVKLIKQ